MPLSWYYYRLQTMSIPEIGFRVRQYRQKQKEKKKYVGMKPNVSLLKPPARVLPLNSSFQSVTESTMNIFGQSFDYSAPIDWHLDISSQRRFPKSFAKDINIRTSEYGSAKHVWEVNRLQFLPLLALQYRQSHDEQVLQQFQQIVASWIEENPYLIGVNWYSNIEVNIRLIVWFFCWELLDVNTLMQENKAFRSFVEQQWVPTIYLHCQYSYQNPSYYSSANNHLISEYAGLFVAASFWKFAESDTWLNHAKKGLEREIIVQHSSNGINKEEAAEYIQFITDFFLIPFVVAEKTGNSFSDGYRKQLEKILGYIFTMMDVRGNIPYYGDEDDGKVAQFESGHVDNFKSLLTSGVVLFGQAAWKNKCNGWDNKNAVLFGEEGKQTFESVQTDTSNQESRAYPEEGHYFLRKQQDAKETYIHIDSAPLGFLSIAAHGHADALAFDLHVDGFPFITDSGTYTYHTDREWRDYFISTLAHNTIRINETNQAKSTGPTMWVNHYKVKPIKSLVTDAKDTIVAEHYGYRKLGVVHRRAFSFDKHQGILTIIDDVTVKKSREYSLEFPLHFHPAIHIEQTGTEKYTLSHEQARKVEIHTDPSLEIAIVRGQTDPILGWYSPSFQLKEPTNVLYATRKFSNSIQIETQIRVQS
uniref:Alginate lyase family protein n=1 Tax=Roseihalotalea indica TaxID=2867963 RepID=A0AA49GJA3_9BACT|nr:alginate lyase family protein [Tunicatimonas sp. TK19036]